MAALDRDALRTRFCQALSDMYKQEVPLYGDLLRLVHDVDDDVVRTQHRPPLAPRHRIERHGAIRLGTPRELRTIGRLFALLGMHPVGYYDLTVVGFPLHATAFRPVTAASLAQNPFRVFTTLLRIDLLPADIRALTLQQLAQRQLFSPRLLQLLDQTEASGSLADADADTLLAEALNIFRWHAAATIRYDDYTRLLAAHPMVADIASFPSAHINHLTPRTLDIDRVQAIMQARGLPAKDRIEGPPPRACGILLRQTSFKALEEAVTFGGGDGQPVVASHTARFGEVEQRGAALTRTGRDLYDQLLLQARADEAQRPADDAAAILQAAFAAYPDDWDTLRREKLTYNYYTPTAAAAAVQKNGDSTHGPVPLSTLLASGRVTFEPITYEDFLPVSAAGIFTSNLRATSSSGGMQPGHADKATFEKDLGQPVADEVALYEAMQEQSVEECRKALGLEAIVVD